MSSTANHTAAVPTNAFIRSVKVITAIALFLMCPFVSTHAQTVEPAYVRAIGSDSLPLAGVTLTWQENNDDDVGTRYAITDITGKATLLLSGRANVSASFVGFEPQRFSMFPGDSKSILMQRAVSNLETVVVTGQLDATRPQQSAENVRVIDRAAIERMQARNVRDLLQQQMDVRVTEDNMLGSNISMHGLSGNNVKIMVDGVPVVGRENGNIDLGQLMLNNVEQVEIVEGPMSVLYSTDAVAGVINLITRRSNAGKSTLQLNANAEAPRSLYADGNAWLQLKKSHVTLACGRHYFDGFPAFDESRVQQWKPSLKYFANAGYGWKTGKTTTELKADYFSQLTLDRGKPTSTPYEAYAFDKQYETRRLGLSAFFNYDISRNLKLDHTAAVGVYTRSMRTLRKDLTTLFTETLNGEGTNTNTDIAHVM
ncbi:MAG TPA: TonB-dependent receptor plug domain-containing protein, partial [Chitinophagales bacterium]|nr:TonB-dependent receptor plug domain-containing protein [Chitinophagales bacterium]